MTSLLSQLREIVSAALSAAFGDVAEGVDPLVKSSSDSKFGDYQSNVAMSLAKALGAKPREVAQKIVDHLPAAALRIIEPPEIAGPGFINFKLSSAYLQNSVASIPPPTADDRLGIVGVDQRNAQTVVVDYSSPNVAKEMHVGHLRSTIIGDTIARVLAFQGHRVIRQNHLGDWGTQFGRIILSLWHLCMGRRHNESAADFDRLADDISRAAKAGGPKIGSVLEARRKVHQDNLDRDPEGKEFQQFIQTFEPSFELLLPAYRYVNAVENAAEGTDLKVTNPSTGESYPLSAVSRHVAAMLQGKTPHDNTQELDAWRKARDATLKECNAIYRRVGVLLTNDDICGESFYDPLLPGIVAELQAALAEPKGEPGGIRAVCRKDQGAICVFLEKPDGSPAFKGPQGDPLPMIVQKSDGASLYATTDLAATLYRTYHPMQHPIPLHTSSLRETLKMPPFNDGLGADRIIYVVGVPQKLHFEMFFATTRALGWLKKGQREIRMEHVAFGSVLGDDRKMLRTRSGDTVKLKDLLEEAIQRAGQLVRDTEADPDKRRGFGNEEIEKIAETVGIAAVKYADLCQNRNTDYVFSWDKMLALQGNTAPYLLYAYARVRSIHRKVMDSKQHSSLKPQASSLLTHPAERVLAMKVLQLAETIESVAENLLPNFLCDYLYDLAGRFMTFYESCPVLQAPDEATYASRLRLCDLTARASARPR